MKLKIVVCLAIVLIAAATLISQVTAAVFRISASLDDFETKDNVLHFNIELEGSPEDNRLITITPHYGT